MPADAIRMQPGRDSGCPLVTLARMPLCLAHAMHSSEALAISAWSGVGRLFDGVMLFSSIACSIAFLISSASCSLWYSSMRASWRVLAALAAHGPQQRVGVGVDDCVTRIEGNVRRCEGGRDEAVREIPGTVL